MTLIQTVERSQKQSLEFPEGEILPVDSLVPESSSLPNGLEFVPA